MPLTVSGVVKGGTSAAITDTGLLTIANTVSASAISLTAGNISIPGVVSDGGAGAVSLVATTGTITEPGALIAGTLSGSAAGAATLTGSNQIASLGAFTAAGLTLLDAASLTVSGAVNGGASATITDTGLLTIAGSLSAGAVSLTANAISIPGVVSDGGAGTVALIATTGTINETGALIAGTLSGSALGAATLIGGNQIATLGAFTAAGFALNDSVPLTVSGVVSGGASATIVDAGLLTIGNTVGAAAVSLTAGSIAIPGVVTDGGAGTVALIATNGTINETGVLNAGTLTGSAAGAATLTGSNQIATLAGFTAAGFSLNDGVPLTVNGSVNGGPGAAIVDTGLLTVNGSVGAAAVSLTAGDIAIPGVLTDGGKGTVSLIATTGTINETGGLIAGTLSGRAKGAATLTGNNQIAALGAFSASGIVLNDGTGLTINGAVNGGSAVSITDIGPLTIAGSVTGSAVKLTANSIAIPGTLTDGGAGTVSLIATAGGINEPGALIAGTLSGSANGTVNLGGASNAIATLGSFSVGGGASFTLNDAASLLINGPLSSRGIVVTETNTITLANGGQILTDGIQRPFGAIPPELLPTALTNDGAYFTAANFVQTGISTIGNLNGAFNILRIEATGDITFAAIGGLQAPATWLILGVQGGGTATGNFASGALDVVFGNASGRATLTGTVNGLVGQAAAAAGFIGPFGNPTFQLNNCPIHSVNCVLLPIEGAPRANPLQDIVFGSLFHPDDDDDDLLLPIVSDKDY